MNENNKNLTIINHLLGLFTSFIGPLVILLVAKNKDVKKHARVAINWQVSYILYSIISAILVFILIGIPLLIIAGILNIVFCVIAMGDFLVVAEEDII